MPILNKILVGTLFLCSVAAFVLLGTSFLSAFREYQFMQVRKDTLQEKVTLLHQEISFNEEKISQLLRNPDYLQRVAKERLGYTEPGEKVYRF